jgi:MFS family permease
MLFVQFAIGLSVGWILGRVIIVRKHLRIRIFLAVGFLQITSWLILAAQNEQAPTWLLYLVVASISIGAPASMIAMDISRTIIPAERRGSGNGFINVGGHAATFIMMALAGWALDLVQRVTGSSIPFTFTGFRWAMATQVIVLVFGLLMFAVEYRKTRRLAAI